MSGVTEKTGALCKVCGGEIMARFSQVPAGMGLMMNGLGYGCEKCGLMYYKIPYDTAKDGEHRG